MIATGELSRSSANGLTRSGVNASIGGWTIGGTPDKRLAVFTGKSGVDVDVLAITVGPVHTNAGATRSRIPTVGNAARRAIAEVLQRYRLTTAVGD